MFIVGILLFIVCFVSVSSEKSEDYSSWDYGQNALKNLLLKHRKEVEERENAKVEKIGQECYHFDSKKCEYPDYWIHWTGTKCHYGNAQYVDVIAGHKNGLGECGLLAWYFMWIWLALGVTTGLGILGCFCGLPFGFETSCKWCFGGTAIGAGFLCPFISWPFMYILYIEKYRCELCQERYKSSLFFDLLDHSEEHRIVCLENNQSVFDNIPNSSLYTCKTCKTPLKVWPINKLPESKCSLCSNKIINNGTNLHVCFTCAGRARGNVSHVRHICNGHNTMGGNMLQINFKDSKSGHDEITLELLPITNQPSAVVDISNIHQENPNTVRRTNTVPPPSPASNVLPPSPASNVLPPGWQVMTNPVTGAPYALCDPSGRIQSLITENTSNPPPYTEATAYPPTQK